ncbi:hypothetical protein PR003_g27872 [Phytophthora rubi]|uniref:Secreted protein n=1 Tax=Phytophthora rubi TaxID=129364 RepID=A0A6A4BX52_9STRA|nr:hypothetical protein PR002_g26761 [Phytophthora rubi]KAE9004748.1 hypothetical protein PR001_g17632 [Phytophthora rubi]KAE9280741.1 hypothetical protein PR003_g27872 [Phytophthora rubi]
MLRVILARATAVLRFNCVVSLSARLLLVTSAQRNVHQECLCSRIVDKAPFSHGKWHQSTRDLGPTDT